MTFKWAKRHASGRLVFALITLILVALAAAPGKQTARAGQTGEKSNRNEQPSERDFYKWLQNLRNEAKKAGISEKTLDAALGDLAPVRRVVELDRRQPEFTRSFRSYLRRRVTRERIYRGRALLEKHRALLEDIYDQYGVAPRYLIAFWGLETHFGNHMGGFYAVEALATLAYDRRRADFFRAELIHALKIIDQGHVRPRDMTSSWAGAMGHMQFMPSTFNHYALDYTGNGRKDIWGSLPDAFASAANFLSRIGWRPDQNWGRQVRLPKDFNLSLATLDTKKSVEKWKNLGVQAADGTALANADTQASVVLPQGESGPAFLVFDNFRAIMRWNRSVNYAISVGHLADRIVGLPPIFFGPNAADETLSRNQIMEIQQNLNRLGFDAGQADGVAGPRTRAAIRAFQQNHDLAADGYPSAKLLERLRAQ
ncbi:membrane-bound lytic murein transglycosylase B [Desulfosalsimonas propionicica]|uniref:Membrane-bound lytic murein transglycosylase B n=1 Tax=Desulfosalsimonas propionicica TaxID=332175 RepID=A0A7W0HJG0_9BACT|nr:lytic murein transglycosylase [Desulfosalsimonas propionicica]MBA2880041.1 membrane-bound lytic murein transglycosylase B [Desulfosalsimonas propionicica]